MVKRAWTRLKVAGCKRLHRAVGTAQLEKRKKERFMNHTRLFSYSVLLPSCLTNHLYFFSICRCNMLLLLTSLLLLLTSSSLSCNFTIAPPHRQKYTPFRHNVPRLISVGRRHGCGESCFRFLFLLWRQLKATDRKSVV